MTLMAPFPPCPDCRRPLKLRFDTKYVYCLNKSCDYDGIEAGEVVGDGQPGRGLPRPVNKGRSVPWVTPVIGDQAAWTALNATRVREAAQRWLCQYCGDPLDSAPTAWVAVYEWVAIYHDDDAVAAGGAMHKQCMELERWEPDSERVSQVFRSRGLRRAWAM